jgi:HPt (histidine-containing phosphotransfer) domain-containing protein
MESEKLRDEYFPQYVQLKESQKWIIIIPILSTVAGVISMFIGLDQKVSIVIYSTLFISILVSGSVFLRRKNELAKYDKIDLKRLLDATSGDVEMEEDLLNALRQNVVDRLPLLKAGLQNKIKDQAVLYSHDFKGSCATIGLEGVRKTAMEMERLSKENRLDAALQLYPQLAKEIGQGFELLESYIQNKKRKAA